MRTYLDQAIVGQGSDRRDDPYLQVSMEAATNGRWEEASTSRARPLAKVCQESRHKPTTTSRSQMLLPAGHPLQVCQPLFVLCTLQSCVLPLSRRLSLGQLTGQCIKPSTPLHPSTGSY
jgi:hypothetical protein